MTPIVSVSKYTLTRIVLVLLCISITVAVYSQRIDCGEQYSQLIKLGDQFFKQRQYKKAFEVYRSARGCVESDIQLIDKKLNAVLDAVDKERETADLEKKKAQELEAIALNESIMAQKAKKTSDSLLIESEKARTQLLEQQNYMKLILDSLGRFDSREQALIKFNQIKEKADTFYVRKQLDSAYYAYLQVREILDENPLIRIGKEEIYSRIDQGKAFIDKRELTLKKLSQVDSLLIEKKFKNFAMAFEILFQLSGNKIPANEFLSKSKILSSEIDLYLKENNRVKDSLHVLYTMVEVCNFIGDQNTVDQLVSQLKKDKNFSLKQVLEKYNEFKLKTHYNFKDLIPKAPRYYHDIQTDIFFAIGNTFSYKIASNNNLDIYINNFTYSIGYGANITSDLRGAWNKPIYSYGSFLSRREFRYSTKDSLTLNNINNERINLSGINKDVKIVHNHFVFDFKIPVIKLVNKNNDKINHTTIRFGFNTGILKEYYPNGVIYQIPSSLVQQYGLGANTYNYPALQKAKYLYTFGYSAELNTTIFFNSRRYPTPLWGIKYDSTFIFPFKPVKENNISYAKRLSELYLFFKIQF